MVEDSEVKAPKSPFAMRENEIKVFDGKDGYASINTVVYKIDMGYINENGSLYIVDRIKKMIVRFDGFKVFPSLIEKSVISHSAVTACCAVGVSDKEHSQGKLPYVFAVLKSDYKGREQTVLTELSELCSKELPEYAQPVGFRFVESLPLTPIGKVDYRALEKKAGNHV